MNSTLILPEMLEAGMAAYTESQQADLPPLEMLVEIYLAMEGMRQIVKMRNAYGLTH